MSNCNCSCNSASTYSAGCGCGCGNQGCCSCRPYNSCDPAFPLECNTLGVTLTPSALVVEDSAFCKHTIQAPDSNAVLTYNSETGLIEWTTEGLCVDGIPVSTATEQAGVLMSNGGCLTEWKPDYATAPKQIILATPSSINWANVEDIYPSGCGLLSKDCGGTTEGDVTFQTGTLGQVPMIDADGNVRFDDLSGLGLGVGIRGLSATNSSSTVVNITAVNALVFDVSGNTKRVNSVSLSLNIGTSGAGGLDTGTKTESNWYYAYIIYDSTNATVNGILSLSPTAPTLPGTYDFYRPVSVVRNGSGNTFINYYQAGNQISIDYQNVFSSAAGSLTYVSQSISSYVPPGATFATGLYGTAGATDTVVAVAGTTNGMGKCQAGWVNNSNSIDGFGNSLNFTVPLPNSQTIFLKAADTSSTFRLDITGYTINF